MSAIATDTVQLTQGDIRYRDVGTGEPIVFIHGLLVNGRLWERPVELLRKDFRCIVPELPLGSHRAPMREDADLAPPALADMITEVLERLDLEKVTLVGNDTGGALCQLAVTRNPERVGRLVLTNCDMYDVFPPKLFAYLGLLARIPGGLAMAAQSQRIKALRRSPMAYGVLAKSRFDDDLLEDWVRPGLDSAEIRRDTRKVILGIDPAQTVQAAKDLEAFKSPTLFAWAPEDRWFKVELAERLAASMPDARVVRIADSKTFVAYDQPQRLADEITSFIRETKPVAAAA
jgi:pimeloyl-ACP methyl ester carboxylesterase